MAKVLCQSSGAISLAASATRWLNTGFSSTLVDTGTESRRAHTQRTAGVLSNLYINVLTNNRGASTFRTRKGTNNANLVVSITASGTGKFEDTTNTDAVTAGDNWHGQIVTGAGGTVFTVRTTAVLFAATTNTGIVRGGNDVTFNTASATTPVNIWGNEQPAVGGVDSDVGTTYRIAGTLKNMLINVRTNARTTTTTLVSRVNSLTANLTISISAAATGILEDTSNSDIISIDDLVNFAFVSGTGTENLVYDAVFADFGTTTNKQMYVASSGVAITQAAGVTTYYFFSGRLLANTTETNQLVEANLAFTASNLQCNITDNSIVIDSTLKLIKNSSAGNAVVTITALTTGVFQDTVNTDSIVATDTLDYEIVTPSTLTSISIRSISMLGDSSLSRNINTFERKTFRGVLRGVGRGSI